MRYFTPMNNNITNSNPKMLYITFLADKFFIVYEII
jgi:hypothetical protein